MWKHSQKADAPASEARKISSTQTRPLRPKTFDVETGQVYTEAHARIRPRHHSDWIGELKTPSLAKSVSVNPKGARSLLEIAKIAAIKQLRNLTDEHLAVVPWSIGKGIWEEITASRRESFHAWRIFAQSYPAASEFGSPKYRYHLHIRQPSLALEDYLRGIGSEKVSWLTCLRISPKETRVPDLVSLANIPNLAVLDLSDGQVAIDTKVSSFDERVMRTWAELAQSLGKLKQLRVILLGWQEHLSVWLFKYLNRFPLLRQVVITDCPKIHQKNRKEWEPFATEKGWAARHSKRSAKSLRPILNEPGFHVGAVSGVLSSRQESPARVNDTSSTRSEVPRPVLEFWLGTPRTWTHILDDFPSTRTIIFDRVEQQLPTQEIDSVKGIPDPVKRARGYDQSSLEVRSPPPKRTSKPNMKTKSGFKGATDLLSQFENR